ncbi:MULTISPECIES: hypothetical protein [unclassified Imperialibacter]|uniref:hypothetical protein n=1 Tax=unclassified Imperialibacter TaxID=2629706 RepID=UPI001257B950|nr:MULTISPECIES: hypothetical protein [unclassified Imperialibacter]CAD5273218.1 conserved exported hypothetical protein [Imperialibacter sp. 89]CAD5288894.1 conserved exported hypothetical protein [Imperialibacter sp. 75]VVT14381.1 conserved exported hypothetical protein [Imperialibacter sp. EC-SDR9]
MKMRTILLTFLVLLSFLSSNVLAQGYEFRVLANKGENQVKKAGASQAETLKTGATLAKGDQIIAANGAYIGLVHSSGKTTEIRTPGTVKIDDLSAKISATSSTTASRYANYIAAKMNESDGGGNYRSNMKATGAVERALTSAINVMLPNSVDFYGDNAIVRWKAIGEDNTTYIVTVKNIFDEEVAKIETDQTAYELDFTNPKLAQERLVILNVKVKGDEDMKSSDYGIKRLSNTESAKVNENIKGLKSEVNEETPLNKIIYASFFEENNLVLDALTKYEEAIEMSPEVQDFQDMYQSFLVKNGLVATAN